MPKNLTFRFLVKRGSIKIKILLGSILQVLRSVCQQQNYLGRHICGLCVWYKEIQQEKKESQKPVREAGRPQNKIDEEPRKKGVDTPKSTPGVADLIVWATSAFESMDVITKGYLEMQGKSNMRQLTKAQITEVEHIKLSAFLNLPVMCELSNENIHKALSKKVSIPKVFAALREESETVDHYKKLVVSKYVEFTLS